MHSHAMTYFVIACFGAAILAAGVYLVMARGGIVSNTTASALDAAESVLPQPPTQEVPDNTPPQPSLPAVVERLRADLAMQLGKSPDDIVVMKVDQEIWPDSCLGLGGAAESCAMALVPGYRIAYSAGFGRYTYRTDLRGESIRVQP